MLNNIQVIILAGGQSSRLWPIQDKSLIKFSGLPLLSIQLKSYMDIGLKKFIIVTNNENNQQIQSIAEEFSGDIEINLVIQDNPLGMGDAILKVEPLLNNESSNTPVYICQVHDVFNDSLHKKMVEEFLSNPARSYLAGIEVTDYFPGGYLITDGDHKITGIIEKPGIGNEPSNLVNIVAHIHPNLSKLLSAIKVEYSSEIESDDHYERALGKLMMEYAFKAIPYSDYWFPIKYPWHVLDLMTHYLSSIQDHRGENVIIEDGVNITGPVYIDDNVRIFNGADIRGPVYVGKGVVIGQFSSVRQSMIGDNSIIGLRSEVNRSYIGEGTDMHTSLALDSITVDNDQNTRTNISAGVITANFRMDNREIKTLISGNLINTDRTKFGSVIGPGTFISINASIAPGIKIGRECQIGMNTNVMEDIPDNTRFYYDQAFGKIKRRNRKKN